MSIRPVACRWCGKPIVFGITPTTARRALDAASIKGYLLYGDGIGIFAVVIVVVWRAFVARKDDPESEHPNSLFGEDRRRLDTEP